MTIQRSIVLLLATSAYGSTNAFPIVTPAILTPIGHPFETTAGIRTTTTTTRHLFAWGRGSLVSPEPEPSKSASELSSREMETYDPDDATPERAVAGEDDLYDEIAEKTEGYDLGGLEGWVSSEDDMVDGGGSEDEDEVGSGASQMIFRDSPAFSITKFLGSFSYSFLGKKADVNDDPETRDVDEDRDVSGAGNGYVEGRDRPRDSIMDVGTDHKGKDDGTAIAWDVYIDQSKSAVEKGAIATLDSFHALSPPNTVQIHSAILSKTKGKGPTVRCIQRRPPSSTPSTTPPHAFEVNNVNDVDKVYLILTHHMKIPSVSTTARSCLKWTYRGNAHLEQENLPSAIRAYDRALSPLHLHPPHEGTLLLLRATAYLKRAFHHQSHLRSVVDELTLAVPDPIALGRLFQLARKRPPLANALFRRFLNETRTMQTRFQQTKYRHGLYEYSLLHAARDSLRATQLMPESAEAYLRAADSLAELRKLKESVEYYERAMKLDPSLEGRIRPVVERLMRSWEGLERAKAMGWSGDTLRLALDVAG